MNIIKCRLKKDDKVKVIIGKDRGKVARVLNIDRKKQQILVENVNVIKKHMRPSAQNRRGGIVERESPIHWSNVVLLCKNCMASTRIRLKVLDDGNKVRVCTKCGEYN